MRGEGPVTGEGMVMAADPGAALAADGPLLAQVKGLTAGYGRPGQSRPALQGIGLELRAGEMVAVVGPNGSGKTTLVRCIAGVLRPWSGEVRVCGADVTALPQREVARRVAVVPQDPSLPDGFAALETVLMGRTPYLGLLQNEGPADLEAARRAMLATGVWDLAARPLGSLSGGERRRVVLARALAQDTPVLLLDEPTAHLDIGHQAAVLRLVRALCRSQSKAALAVVHDLTLAGQFADRLVLMDRGRVVAEGSAEDVLRPSVLGAVYGTRVRVLRHPDTGRPVVAPGSEDG